MNELALTYENTAVRTITECDCTWWALIDVCTILSLSNSRMVASQLDEDEVRKFNLRGLEGETWFVNEPGLYHVILTSRSEKAKPFRRWVTHEVLPSIRKQGFYSMLTDEKLIEVLTERTKKNPDYLQLIDKTKIKKEALQGARDDKMERTRQLWFRRFTQHEDVNVQKELRQIWAGDMPMYHKYLDKFHTDERKECKGEIITI